MEKLLRYIIKIFYDNQSHAKYGAPSIRYFMALMAGTFYIMITGLAILFIAMAVSPEFYRHCLTISTKMPTMPSGIVILGFIFCLLRILIKEDSLKGSPFTKEYVNRAINYLLAYSLAIGIFIVFLGVKFLRNYRGH